MEMLLAGHNMHRLEDVEIVAPGAVDGGTPAAAPPAPPATSPEHPPADPLDPLDPLDPPDPPDPLDPPVRPEEVNEATLRALARRLRAGERWDLEPDHPLEGLTVVSRLRHPPRAGERVDVEDLHGVRQANLEPRLRQALDGARARGHRFVRVITGRGLGSAGGYPVLRYATALWLARARREGLVAEAAIEGDLESFGSFLLRLPRSTR